MRHALGRGSNPSSVGFFVSSVDFFLICYPEEWLDHPTTTADRIILITYVVS